MIECWLEVLQSDRRHRHAKACTCTLGPIAPDSTADKNHPALTTSPAIFKVLLVLNSTVRVSFAASLAKAHHRPRTHPPSPLLSRLPPPFCRAPKNFGSRTRIFLTKGLNLVLFSSSTRRTPARFVRGVVASSLPFGSLLLDSPPPPPCRNLVVVASRSRRRQHGHHD